MYRTRIFIDRHFTKLFYVALVGDLTILSLITWAAVHFIHKHW